MLVDRLIVNGMWFLETEDLSLLSCINPTKVSEQSALGGEMP
jgi:hypothetical protein